VGDGKPSPSTGSPTNVRRNPVPSLLESMGRDPLDPGYVEAAKRKAALGGSAGSGSGRNGRAWAIAAVAAACAIVGLLFGVSASTTESNQPRTEKARAGLLEDIDRAEQRQSQLASSAADLAEQLRATQSELGGAGPLQTVAALEMAGQITPVTGVIQDRDVQLLVNDLWAAGAEAVAIGGVRVQPRSAIRQAGGAILVDNRPVFWPITIEAVGDPAGLQVKSVGAPGFGRFSTFAQLYGIEFDVSAQQNMTLPGGSGADLLFASAPAQASQTPTPASSSPPTR
jgi:uncharacterized protein YlxW (UPF0749 family)